MGNLLLRAARLAAVAGLFLAATAPQARAESQLKWVNWNGTPKDLYPGDPIPETSLTLRNDGQRVFGIMEDPRNGYRVELSWFTDDTRKQKIFTCPMQDTQTMEHGQTRTFTVKDCRAPWTMPTDNPTVCWLVNDGQAKFCSKSIFNAPDLTVTALPMIPAVKRGVPPCKFMSAKVHNAGKGTLLGKDKDPRGGHKIEIFISTSNWLQPDNRKLKQFVGVKKLGELKTSLTIKPGRTAQYATYKDFDGTCEAVPENVVSGAPYYFCYVVNGDKKLLLRQPERNYGCVQAQIKPRPEVLAVDKSMDIDLTCEAGKKECVVPAEIRTLADNWLQRIHWEFEMTSGPASCILPNLRYYRGDGQVFDRPLVFADGHVAVACPPGTQLVRKNMLNKVVKDDAFGRNERLGFVFTRGGEAPTAPWAIKGKLTFQLWVEGPKY